MVMVMVMVVALRKGWERRGGRSVVWMPEGLGGVVGVAEVLGTWWRCYGGRSGRYIDWCRGWMIPRGP